MLCPGRWGHRMLTGSAWPQVPVSRASLDGRLLYSSRQGIRPFQNPGDFAAHSVVVRRFVLPKVAIMKECVKARVQFIVRWPAVVVPVHLLASFSFVSRALSVCLRLAMARLRWVLAVLSPIPNSLPISLQVGRGFLPAQNKITARCCGGRASTASARWRFPQLAG